MGGVKIICSVSKFIHDRKNVLTNMQSRRVNFLFLVGFQNPTWDFVHSF